MSSRKGDVDRLLDCFNINAGNPLTVMTQDIARAFLSGGGSGGQSAGDAGLGPVRLC